MAVHDLFAFNVFVHGVRQEGGTAKPASSVAPALACRFLDYPAVFIQPQRPLVLSADKHAILFRAGKSCLLQEQEAQLQGLVQQVQASPLCARHACWTEYYIRFTIILNNWMCKELSSRVCAHAGPTRVGLQQLCPVGPVRHALYAHD